ncbi:MAG: nicotinamidase [Chloroflexi bacterium]|nr:nicotinamidase [Chloroflexota bacterium]
MEMESALLVVDVQNDFCAGGSLEVKGGDEIVPVLNHWIERARDASRPIVATRDWHPAETIHFQAYGGTWPPHCVQGTQGARFHPGLALPNDALIVSSGTRPDEDGYSGFDAVDEDGQPLSEALRRRGVRKVYVGGLATDYCVRATVLDALKAGFEVGLIRSAVRGVDLQPGDSERALEEMRAAGAEIVD